MVDLGTMFFAICTQGALVVMGATREGIVGMLIITMKTS